MIKNHITPIPQPPRKSAGQYMGEMVIYLIVVGVLLWILQKFLAFLFAPLRGPYKRDEIEKKVNKDFDKAVERRERHIEVLDRDEKDPMHQFQVRFLTEVERYKGDPDNERYFLWYKQWQEGRIIDSGLRWAPEITVNIFKMNPQFLKYLHMQVELHRKAGLLRRALFLTNIRLHYPEFTPSLSGLEQDIKAYGIEIEAEDLEGRLKVELEKFGLSKVHMKYLLDRNLGAQELRSAAEFLQKCSGLGYSDYAGIIILEQHLDPASEKAREVHEIVGDLELPQQAAEAFLAGNITREDLEGISEKVRNMKGFMGLDFYRRREGSGASLYEEVCEELIRKARAVHQLKKVGDICRKA